VVEETLDYVLREMTHAQGGFFSAQDADSQGEEGKFYVWAQSEIKSRLEPGPADVFCHYFGVSAQGNFEGKNILTRHVDTATAALEMGLEEEQFLTILETAQRELFQLRQSRVKPARDEKVLTAWNGLMLAAFAEAGRVLDRNDYLQAAQRNAEFVLGQLKRDGRLLRSWRAGDGEESATAKTNAFLEDYAFLAHGLLALYQATFDTHMFVEARTLADTILEHFSDSRAGFFDTSDDHERLIVRPKQLQDNAIPSGNAMAAGLLLQLAAYTGSSTYRDQAEGILTAMSEALGQSPSAFGHWLSVLAFDLAPATELAVVGRLDAPDTQALLKTVSQTYHPHLVIACRSPEDEKAAERLPLLRDRVLRQDKATAYVCQGFRCQSPTTDPSTLAEQLG
jgi:uncharacterized protein YyaL (SSP411 family)